MKFIFKPRAIISATPTFSLLRSLVSRLCIALLLAGGVSVIGTPPAVALTCAQGGPCALGDTGPGGGKIFYYSAAGFNCGANFSSTGSPTGGLCHYLEAAPSGSTSGTFKYASTGLDNSDVSGITNDTNYDNSSSAIGLGYKNSLTLVAQGNDNTSAAGIARAYQGGSKSDWYLPSFSELNQMCKWARNLSWVSDATVCTSAGTLNTGPGAAGFDDAYYDYWSSSEISANSARVQFFGDGGQGAPNKNLSKNVRPIRAF
jgi:hypothetical protein